jgi:hypothetical protein
LGVSRFTDVLTNFSADAPALQAFTERARCILGYNSSKRAPEPDALDGFLLAFASVYRIGVLDLTGEEILRALAVAEIMTRRVWSGLPQEPTLQGVANTLTALKPIQILLAHGDERFDFGKVTKKTFSFRDAELTFAAFIAARHAPDAGVFAALEQAIPPGMSIADRSVLLRRLGEIMQTVRLKPRRRKGAIVEGILSSQDLGDNRIVRELAQQ